MILFWKKLRCNKKGRAFLPKRRLKSDWASYVLLGLTLILGNSCVGGECSKPTDDLGEIVIVVPKIVLATATCPYYPRLLQDAADLGRELSDGGWVAQIILTGKCGENVWEEKYKKNDFDFSKKFDGSMTFSLPNVPYHQKLSLKLKLYSNCNDNAMGNCFEAGVRDYRYLLSGGMSLTPSLSSRRFELDPLEENGVYSGPDWGCL